MKIKLIYLFILPLLPALLYSQKEKNIPYLTMESFTNGKGIALEREWEYKFGDDLNWAEKDIETTSWQTWDYNLSELTSDSIKWTGIGWFRKTIQIDSSLFGKTIGVNVWQTGAIEFYLNGKKQFSMGIVGNAETEERELAALPQSITFDNNTTQVIAVRYSNHLSERYGRWSSNLAMYFALTDFEYSIQQRFDSLFSRVQSRAVFIGVSAILMFLHFFLYWFDKRQIQNLYYVLFLFFFSLFIFINFQSSYLIGINAYFYLARFHFTALGFTIFFGAITIYSIYAKPPGFFKILFAAGLVISILGYFSLSIFSILIGYAYILITSILGSWVLYSPKFQKPYGGERIIQFGFFVMAAAGTYQMAMSFGWVGPILGANLPYIYGVFFFLISMSLSLARDSALISRSLEKQLKNVKQLSDKTLQQELEAKEMETEKRILEADNERKTVELEEARKVQLSMLPTCANDFEGLDICFHMTTATEVGGDYYDFNQSNDGTVSIAIGDATGHGMKAGIMVATIKSLFSALGNKLIIPDFFQKCTEIIKSMSLGNLFMSMSVIRIKNNVITGSSAGMPPILIYRHELNKIEEIVVKSMPLGAVKNFSYEIFQINVSPGDVMLMMSDGFPELFNPANELLGYERVEKIFKENISGSSNDIVSALIKEGKNWSNGRPNDDDITFVVIRFK
jgi:serine phosphatase RsbU (regulator of sigma subunit)